MSKPVSHSETEDVLSSVLRLVRDSKKTVSAKEQPEDKLVLTPQLRVKKPGVLQLTPDRAVGVSQGGLPGKKKLQEASGKQVPDKRGNASLEAEQTVASTRKATNNLADLSAKINALETAIAKTAGQWEPDGASRDAYAGKQSPALDWRNFVELDGMGKPVTAQQVDTTGSTTELQSNPMDEDALRSVVAEIVRSELRGELGDRITRNVRKLVRQEILRALSVQTPGKTGKMS